MNFDSSTKITLFNIKEAQGLQGITGATERFTSQPPADNPAKAFINKLLERVKNIGQDADSVEDLLVKRNNVFTNLRLVLNDSEIIDYFQKFVDGADIPIEETLDLFSLAYDTNIKIGKNIREILEFILNHRTWNRNPGLTKDIVDKTVSLATSTSTRFFPYFSMLLGVSDPAKRDLSSLGMISGLDPESQIAFREIVNLAAKTDKDTLESIRIQQQAAQDALDVAKDKYSLTRGIIETLEKSSYDERLAKTIGKLEQLFRKRYSAPGYRQIKLMMFDLHFGQIIYKQLFADLNSTTDLRQKTKSSNENSRIAFTLDAYTADEIKDFNKQDFEDFKNFLIMANKLNIEQKNKISTIINDVSNKLNKLVFQPEKYKENYAKIMDAYYSSLAKLLTNSGRTSSRFSRVVTAAPPVLPSGTPPAIVAAITALSAIPGVGPALAPLISSITGLFSSAGGIFSANYNLVVQTITEGLATLTAPGSFADLTGMITAISTGDISFIQKELTKYMNGDQLNPNNVDKFFKLLKLTALVNRDFTSVVTIMMTDALLRKNQKLKGLRPLPARKVTQEERDKIIEALQNFNIDGTITGLVLQLKDFRTQTLASLNNQKELADSFKSINISIPGVNTEAPLTGNEFAQSTQQYYNDLTKAIRMFQYEKSLWESLDTSPAQREALSVFLKGPVSEIKKDIQLVTKKLGEVYILGIGNNAQVDVNIRKLEQENIVNTELFSAEKTLGVSAPLSGISLRENLVTQRAQYEKLLSQTEAEFNAIKSVDAEARITGDYKAALLQVERLIGKELVHLEANPDDIKREIQFRIDILDGSIQQLNAKIIKLTTDIISTSEGNRTSMSKFEKIIKHSDENVMSVDLTENVKEADEVTEDYWNHLLPGFGSAMEKPKKWRKKLTEDIPVKFNNTRKWTQ
jgi:hypothetical protein